LTTAASHSSTRSGQVGGVGGLDWWLQPSFPEWLKFFYLLNQISYGDGSRRSSTWPRGYTPCWQVYTNKTRVMPFIPTKSVTCMSASWLLGNVFTAKSYKGKRRDPDALKLGLVG
jgi:hypothetical protein